MTTKTQLLQSIKKTKSQLESLEKELASCKTPTIQEASVGDVLEDGSVVLIKGDNHSIVAASQSTEFQSTWDELEQNKIKAFKSQGLNPLEWFIPSKELLYLAYKTIPDHFQKRWYWSSSEFDASIACNVGFCNGGQYSSNKSNTNCVRAFRVIVF